MDLLIVLGIPLIGVACGIAFLCGLAIGWKCCWLWLLLAGFSTVPVGGIAMLGAFQGAFNSEPVNLYRTDFFGHLAELLERSEHPVQAAKQMEAEVAAGVWERKCEEFLPPQLPDAVLYVGIVCAIVAFSALRMKNSWKHGELVSGMAGGGGVDFGVAVLRCPALRHTQPYPNERQRQNPTAGRIAGSFGKEFDFRRGGRRNRPELHSRGVSERLPQRTGQYASGGDFYCRRRRITPEIVLSSTKNKAPLSRG